MPKRVSPGILLPALLLALTAGCGAPAHSEREIEATGQASAGAGNSPNAPAGTAAPASRSIGGASITPEAVRQKVEAIFAQAVVPARPRKPDFALGDFNGDGSQDIAVLVKPAPGALEQINSPVANWMIKDVDPQETAAAMKRREPVRVEATDLLLAVIHGYGEAGWLNPEAKQTLLLRDAVHDDGEDRRGASQSIRARPLTGLMPVPPARVVPGDVILTSRDDEGGFIYWTGATYLRHAF
jgi:hypothetical protein